MKIIPQKDVNFPALGELLKQGSTLVYPTETCYGLGCDARNSDAVKKVFAIKNRDPHKPVLVVFSSTQMVKEYVGWNDTLEALSQKYWPGALTIVAELKPGVALAPGVISMQGTIACRVSSHPFVHHITTLLGAPIVSTSANIAGEGNPYDPVQIEQRFLLEKKHPDILIDNGVLPFQPPSTLIEIKNHKIKVLRQGSVRVE